MFRKGIQLACDNEHGTGDMFFPDDEIFTDEFRNVAHLRREAKKAGWKRRQRADYCPICTALEEDREECDR